MSDLISRSKTIEFLQREIICLTDDGEECKRVILNCLTKSHLIPSVEAVPVVHCKDCKHWHKDTGWCDKHSHFIDYDGNACHPWESNDWKMFGENDFCSDGERKAV